MKKDANCLLLAAILTFWFMPASAVQVDSTAPKPIDRYSYNLGGFTSFAEVVSLGIKTLALSAALPSDEIDALIVGARDIATKAGVQIYREPDFMITDLFPIAATYNKHVILIYQGSTLKKYLALKTRKTELLANHGYSGAARESVARELGLLLSYPIPKITELVNRNKDKEP